MMISETMSSRGLKIAVADDEGFMRKYLQTVLPRLGHEVVAVAENGRDLIEMCRNTQPDLVITDVNMPEMDGLEAAAEIYSYDPIPIVVISGYHGPEVIERTVAAHVMAYLVKPIKQSDLEPVITLAMRRFEQLQSLRTETTNLRNSLEARQTIEKALAVLMKWAKEGEEDALHHLEKLAGAQQLEMIEIAQMILAAEETIRPPDHAAPPVAEGKPPVDRKPPSSGSFPR